MSICINTSHPDFIALQESTEINPAILKAKVALWQQRNNSDEFPAANELVGIKKGVKELFEENPELASIGTPEQYSQYLDTIFPDSKVKDIVYHGVIKGKHAYESILKNGFTQNFKSNWDDKLSEGIFFSDKNTAFSYGFNEERIYDKNAKDFIIAALLNVDKLITDKETSTGTARKTLEENPNVRNLGMYGLEGGSEGEHMNHVVFKPEQIHILGSKQDIESFKRFTEGSQTPVFFQQPNALNEVRKVAMMYNMSESNFFGPQINPDEVRPKLRKLGFGLKKTRTGTGYFITKNGRMFKPFTGPYRNIKAAEVPADSVIDGRMKDIMNDLGISLTDFEQYSEWYETTYGEKLQANAVADMMQKVIAVKEGAQKIDTLPEEVAHFIVFALRNDSRVQELMDNVEGTPIWDAESEAYMQAYNNDVEKVKMEIVGKMVADALIKGVTESTTPRQRTLIQRIWNAFKNFFTFGTKVKERRVRTALDSIVSQTLNDTKSIKEELEKQVTGDEVFFQIDTKAFENSKILDGMKPELEQAITIVSDKIKRYQTKEKYTAKERTLLSKLHRSLDDNRTTQGLVTFINKVESEADLLLDRLVAVRRGFQEGVYDDNLNEFGSSLRDLSVYIEAYRPLVDSLMSETVKQKRMLEEEDPASYGEDGISLNSKIQQLDKIIKSLNNINNGMTAMSEDYNNYSTNLFVSAFRPFLERRYAGEPDADMKVTKEIERLLKLAESTDRDVPFLRRWVDSVAESTDDLLMLTDRLVKEHLEKAAFEVDDIMKDILDADAKLKASGIENTEWLYERSKGALTGNYISEINVYEFNKAKDEFFDDLHDRFGLSKGRENVKVRERELANLNPNAYADYQMEIAKWFEKNTEPNPNYQKILDAKRESIYKQIVTEKFDKRIKRSQQQEAERIYQEWKNERYVAFTLDGYNEQVSFRRELAMPKKSIYGNAEFAKLTPAQREYYDSYMKLREELTKHMPEKFRNNMTAIQIRKDFIERAKADPKRTLSESIRDAFVEREDDTEFGRLITDESGNPIKNVPIYYFNELDNMTDLSTDATATMIMFADMATRHRELSRIVDIIEIGRDVIGKRKILTGAGVKQGGNALDRYVDYMNMVVYGELKNREGELFGISKAKAADALAKYTAINGLALNVYAGFSNILFGEVMIREEQFAKEYVDSEDMKFAEKQYWLAGKDGISGLMGDVGKTRSSNKLRLFMEKFDVLQDFENRTREVNTDRSRWGRMFNSSAMFFVNHVGEHQMQGRMALALAHNKKVKDSSGKEIPMYEAFEVKNNRLVIKDGIKNLDGSDFTQQDMIAFKLRMKGVNQKLHGIYNTTDRGAMQKFAVGRLGILFRKWLKPAFNRRFDRQYYNYSLDQEVEGMWITTGNFMKQLFTEYKEGQFTFSRVKEAYNELPDNKKANIRRTLTEQGLFLATLFTASALVGLADDDDDNWLLNMAAYQAERLSTELGMFNPITLPKETLKIVSSPSAAVNQLDSLLDLYKTVSLNPFDDEPLFRRYKSGRNKDSLRLYVWSKKTIPLVDTVEDIFYPEERLKYFIN